MRCGPPISVRVQCLIVLRICKGMGQELLEVIDWEGSAMHDVVVNVDPEKKKMVILSPRAFNMRLSI